MTSTERDINWVIGGPQGSGINVAAETFAKALVRAGYRVYAAIEYHSNIMGKHSYYRVRISDADRRSPLGRVHVLVSLDEETLLGDTHHEFPAHRGHLHEVVPGGAVVFDARIGLNPGRDDLKLYPIPYAELLELALMEFGRQAERHRFRVVQNVIALSASAAVLGFELSALKEAILEGFKGRRAEAAGINLRAAELAYEYIKTHFADDFGYRLSGLNRRPERRPLLVRGVQAAAIAKIKAGLGFQSYYPISPATDENVYLEAQQRKYGFVVVQAEDEVAAINMAVGAAHAGVRAATSTSGPGFTLMAEGIGFASMTEAPGPVVFLWQRGGPSTGLPTRQEQADLRFALQPAHGEFSHLVVAPGDIEEVVFDSYMAFNWAERYQLPVIVLLDRHLAGAYVTAESLGLEALPPVDRGLFYQPEGTSEGDYFRYAFTETGISPRTVPGTEGGIFWTTSDEHDPRGHITEGAENRLKMVAKRMKKLDVAAREIPPQAKFKVYGPADADFTVIGWGSTKGAILDALEELRAEGHKVNFVQVRLMRPFPAEELKGLLSRAKNLILVEENYTGQLGALICEQTGISITRRVLKWDGRPFTQEELKEGLLKAMVAEGTVLASHLQG
ncbi:MAG: hypothetical protein C4315_03455 [Chloroflexota bacterium]